MTLNIVGYVSGNDPYGVITTLEYSKMTHVIYVCVEVTSATDPTLLFTIGSAGGLSTFVATAKAANPNIKVLLSLAGGNWVSYDQGHLSTLLADNGLRATLITNLGTLMTTYSLDGLGLDCEGTDFDGQSALTHTLISELKTAYPTKIIGVAGAFHPTAHDWWSVSAITDHADFVDIMLYDIHPYPEDALYADCIYYVGLWLAAGYPAAKLNFGVPCYGCNDAGGFCGYGEIVTQENPATSVNSITRATPWFLNAKEVTGGELWWNGYDLVKQKTQWAQLQGLGGMMLETADYDAVGHARSLLRAAYFQIHGETSMRMIGVGG